MHDDTDELITVKEGLALYGGDKKPISPATFYRGVRAGRYSPPVKPSPGISRLSKRKVREDIARIIAEASGDR
jgi:hypothetical protein